MAHPLTMIVEGPRPGDGRVRYVCDKCGDDQIWLLRGSSAVHLCRPLQDPAQRPCAENYLNNAHGLLLEAAAKLRSDQAKRRIELILPELKDLAKMAMLEALQEQ